MVGDYTQRNRNRPNPSVESEELALLDLGPALLRRQLSGLRWALGADDRLVVELASGWVALRYGVKLAAQVLRAPRAGQLPFVITTNIAWGPV